MGDLLTTRIEERSRYPQPPPPPPPPPPSSARYLQVPQQVFNFSYSRDWMSPKFTLFLLHPLHRISIHFRHSNQLEGHPFPHLFRATNPKIFSEAPWAGVYTSFEGGPTARQKLFKVKKSA